MRLRASPSLKFPLFSPVNPNRSGLRSIDTAKREIATRILLRLIPLLVTVGHSWAMPADHQSCWFTSTTVKICATESTGGKTDCEIKTYTDKTCWLIKTVSIGIVGGSTEGEECNPYLSAPVRSAQPEQTVSFSVGGTENCHATPSWTAENGDPATGTGLSFVTKWSCPGSFAVRVTVGGYSVSATVSISSPPPTVTIQADDPTLFLLGQSKDITALGQNAFASSSTGTYTWASGDTSILGISPAGDHVQVSGVNAGSTTLSVSFQNCTGTGTAQIAVQVVAVDIGDLPRVPISGAVNNEKPVSVTITPSPLMSGNTIKLQIQKVSGAGQATFDDGLSVRFISQSATVRIRGTVNSDTKDNLKLTASLGNQDGPSKIFTVSTWPTNFRHSLLTDLQHFGFTVRVEWDSESGSLGDLGNVTLREEVFYTHPGNNPPFTVGITSNPTHTPNPPAPGIFGLFNDGHIYQPQWVDFATRVTDYRIGEQEYQFQDTVLQTPWMGLANYTISKEVIENPVGTYKFRTTKYGPDGFSHTITELP